MKNTLIHAGFVRTQRLGKPVISVGSLSAGGAGKTPLVLALAKLLQLSGKQVDVLSRGYGRSSKQAAEVPVDASASSTLYGDEPVEMMRAGLRVFVGASRYHAGLLAERTLEVQAHLLDDGFQHRQLGRALDIVLVTAEDVVDHLLPAGNLREPLSALRRAHVVVVREEEALRLAPVLVERTEAEIWIIRRELGFKEEKYSRPFAFCGIARPENFLSMLGAAGSAPVGHIVFRDHRAYTREDLRRIVTAAKAAGANGIYLTEKDAVKIRPEWLPWLEAVGPIQAPKLHVQLLDPKAALQTMEKVLAG